MSLIKQNNKTKTLLLFVIVLIHNTILDFFYVTHKGPVFLWEKSSEFSTISVHILIATLVTVVFLIANKIHQEYISGTFEIREKLLVASSVVLVVCISFLLFS